jgi:hypothetical protein
MASGDIVGNIISITPAASDGAAPDILQDDSTDKVNHPIWNFDTTTQEHLDFHGYLQSYGGGGITVTIVWSSNTVAGTVVWEGMWMSFTDDTDVLTTGSYSTAVESGTLSGPTTVGDKPLYDTIAFTDGAQIDSLANGEWFNFRLSRAPANAGDTKADDAYVLGIVIKET